MFATAAYGYKFGDPTKLITPFDSDGMSINQMIVLLTPLF
jgi:hypothetical protein